MAGVVVDPILGTVLHAVGASLAALCYTPQQKLRGWSWQTYWLAQASVGWVLAPILVAWWTIPDLGEVLRAAPSHAMLGTFVLLLLLWIFGKPLHVHATVAALLGLATLLLMIQTQITSPRVMRVALRQTEQTRVTALKPNS